MALAGSARKRPPKLAALPPAIAVLAAAALFASGCSGAGQAQGTPTDVFLVVIDSLRADRAAPFSAATPALAELARDAEVYERATAPATWCAPALGSLFTGRWPSYHGAERDPEHPETTARAIDPSAPTLAELLRASGLRTMAFASRDSTFLDLEGLDRGFDRVVALPPDRDARAVAAAASDWLARENGPVFAFVHLDDLRRDRGAGPRREGAADANARRVHDRADLAIQFARDGGLTPARRQSFEIDYRRRLDVVDRAVSELMGALQRSGRYDQALVVVTADHGELLGEHSLAGHGWPPFEPIVHVPLLVKRPGGLRAGELVGRRVSTLGVFATALDVAGVASPARSQARPLEDLHPVWVEDVDRRGHRARAGYDGPSAKMVFLNDGRRQVECLFDLDSDPSELLADCSPRQDLPLRAAVQSFGASGRPAWPTAASAAGRPPASP
jgi:arylsulfatase A-like enzyme